MLKGRSLSALKKKAPEHTKDGSDAAYPGGGEKRMHLVTREFLYRQRLSGRNREDKSN